MLQRLQLRVRNRRLGRQRYTFFSGVNSSAFGQSMLGCVFILLILFMMYAPSHHGLVLDGYISHHARPMPRALRDDAMRVMLSRDGTIYLGNAKVTSGDLAEQIRGSFRGLGRSAPCRDLEYRVPGGISVMHVMRCHRAAPAVRAQGSVCVRSKKGRPRLSERPSPALNVLLNLKLVFARCGCRSAILP